MSADCKSHPGVVGHEALGFGHRFQWTGVGVGGRAAAFIIDRFPFPPCFSCLSCLSCLSCPSRPSSPSTLLEELAARSHRTLGLPQRGTTIVAERVERADVGEGHDFVAAQASTRNEIVE